VSITALSIVQETHAGAAMGALHREARYTIFNRR
jgi:hypothetical protein